jgi:hypothetical protein
MTDFLDTPAAYLHTCAVCGSGIDYEPDQRPQYIKGADGYAHERCATPRGILLAEAIFYASCLNPGDEIDETVDGSHVAAFRHLLPAALAKRGLLLELRTDGSWVVRAGHLIPIRRAS